MINALEVRKADYPIESLFLKRWSPRAMTGEPFNDKEIMTLFEAARWAPSTYNEQEWRFLYARRDTPQWPLIFDLLVEGNKMWCKDAAILVVIVSHKVFSLNQKPNPVHLFDVGAAYENIALQGAAMNLVVHGMQGFDFAKARMCSRCQMTTMLQRCLRRDARLRPKHYRSRYESVKSRVIANRLHN